MSRLGAGGPLPAEGIGAAAIAVSWERDRCTAAWATDMLQASCPRFSLTPQLSKVLVVFRIYQCWASLVRKVAIISYCL
jgi:hypothetical protein